MHIQVDPIRRSYVEGSFNQQKFDNFEGINEKRQRLKS